ncbi:MAG: phosphoenolpyruvate--protein phosphotransferase [Lachnospiraceae bacterium]|nr:phosphoenolpyruvate--protein phosphotransferase [Lachnospiraceae bacterium]
MAKMNVCGKTVYKAVARGPILVLDKQEVQITDATVADVEAEVARVVAAVDKAKAQIATLYEKALEEVGEESAAIFEVHQMMLEDDEYLDSIYGMIRDEGMNAEFAVQMTGNTFSQIFATMDDDYMRARAADILDISSRVIRVLTNQEDVNLSDCDPSIIVAEDLSPSETVQMDKSKILAFVTVQGSTNSHTAILARMMNIPALVMTPVELNQLQNGTEAIVDGFTGEFLLEPSEDEIAKADEKINAELEKRRMLEALKGLPTETKSGQQVKLYANIGSVEDVEYVLENDAEGIGLFRSEFLYLGRCDLPTEEEQYNAYKKVLTAMGDRRVIIRTLDIGADKQADYLNLDKEENPALGYRAIRICLTQPEVFKTQIRALLRAAVYGKLAVMYPMIISPCEVEQIKEVVAEVEAELKAEGVAYAIPEQGIMIETPASVMMSDELAQMVEFFSIGTNDLTQYTLAIDRQNEKLAPFYDAHHPAVLRMIQMVVDNAHKHGIWAGICGELGADMELTDTFLKMGVDELSVAPGAVLPIRKLIRDAE